VPRVNVACRLPAAIAELDEGAASQFQPASATHLCKALAQQQADAAAQDRVRHHIALDSYAHKRAKRPIVKLREVQHVTEIPEGQQERPLQLQEQAATPHGGLWRAGKGAAFLLDHTQ